MQDPIAAFLNGRHLLSGDEPMANEQLTLSADGIAKLKADEGRIDGLYDDPSGYCTSGVGHLVHQKDKWGCFLLQAASADETFQKNVATQWPGKSYATAYLTRGTAFIEKFDDLKTKAVDAAKETIAQKRHKRSFDKLDKPDQDKVSAAATEAVAEQAKSLAKTTDATLTEDIKPFEKAVRDGVKVTLRQEEFDALVSLCFNIGVAAFTGSSVVTEINKGKYKSGDAKDRKAAIDLIDGAFAKWNKSGGVVLDGLTKRRKSEADRFLAAARAALTEVEKAAASAAGGPPVGGPKPVGGVQLVKP